MAALEGVGGKHGSAATAAAVAPDLQAPGYHEFVELERQVMFKTIGDERSFDAFVEARAAAAADAGRARSDWSAFYLQFNEVCVPGRTDRLWWSLSTLYAACGPPPSMSAIPPFIASPPPSPARSSSSPPSPQGHALGTLGYRWTQGYAVAGLHQVEVTGRTVVFPADHFGSAAVSGAAKAAAIKQALGIASEARLMDALGERSLLLLLQESPGEWELVIPDAMLATALSAEQVVRRFRPRCSCTFQAQDAGAGAWYRFDDGDVALLPQPKPALLLALEQRLAAAGWAGWWGWWG